jgi:hypothetical protein
MTNGRSRRERALWIGLGVAALAVRAALAWRAPIVEVDGAYWLGLAAALERGDWRHGFNTAWPPFYPALVALTAAAAHALGWAREPGVLEACGRAVSVAAGTLVLLPLHALARRLLPPRAAGTVVVLAAFHPRLLQYSAAALSEASYTLLLVAGLALFVAGERAAESGRAAAPPRAASGALFGLAFLTRPEALLLAAALWVFGLLRRDPHRGWRRLRPAFALAALTVALPWLLFLHASLGHWSLGEKGEYNFWRAFAAEYARELPAPAGLAERVNDSSEIALSETAARVRALEFTARQPGLVVGRTLRNLATIVTGSMPAALYWPLALLAALALLAPRAGGFWPVAVTLGAMPLLYAPFSVDRRFLVPAVPLLLVVCAMGLAWVESRVSRATRDERRVRRSVNAGLALVATLTVVYSFGRGARFEDAPEQRAAGEWLRRAWPELPAAGPAGASRERETQDRPLVMARKPWVAFYSGGLIVAYPNAPLDTVLALARRRNVDVLVVDQRSADTDRPQLAPLLDPARPPPGLAVIHREPGPPPLLLYRLGERGTEHVTDAKMR